MGLKSDKPGKLDQAAELAIEWAIATLQRTMPEPGEDGYDVKAFDKDQQRKAQAAALVGMLKARTDPGALRGAKVDRVDAILRSRLKRAGKPAANGHSIRS